MQRVEMANLVKMAKSNKRAKVEKNWQILVKEANYGKKGKRQQKGQELPRTYKSCLDIE